MVLLALTATMASIAIPAAAYFLTIPDDDAQADALHKYGFLPITPPSNLMSVGSLYYVDVAVRRFTPICAVTKADINDTVLRSRSQDMRETLEREGNFATTISLSSFLKASGNTDRQYAQTVHASLTDIVIEELPLGENWLLFGKMMTRPECSRVAMEYVYTSGYVCQGQKLLQATAEFKLDLDANNKLATETKATPEDVTNAIKLAIEAQSKQSVVEREGRLFSGSALQYGVLMNPTCLAPKGARFRRVLPRNAWGRIVNFVLFNIVEPILPARAEDTEVAQASHATTTQ
jgi:hypothetical protein